MYVIYGKVFGGTPNIFMFWLFPENGSISEPTVNRALIVHTTLYNSALTIKKISISIFTMYQNYPLALRCYDGGLWWYLIKMKINNILDSS